MIIDLDKGEIADKPTAIALGNFDGVHYAHQGLIRAAFESKRYNLIPSVLLFKENENFIQKKQILMNLEQKIEVFKNLGIENIFLKKFDEEFMYSEPEFFIEEYLLKRIKARYVVAGFDYRFGRKAEGNVETLIEAHNKYDFDILIIPEIKEQGVSVSSTLIRELIRKGAIGKANKFLTRPYTIIGKIVHGKKIGTDLGFPTANLSPIADYVIPKDGVYRTAIEVDGKIYQSATSVGVNVTFGAEDRTIETYIKDFSGDIYGKTVKLIFLEFEREMIKFDNQEALKAQMAKDINNG